MESLGKGVGWMAGWMMGEQTAFNRIRIRNGIIAGGAIRIVCLF